MLISRSDLRRLHAAERELGEAKRLLHLIRACIPEVESVPELSVTFKVRSFDILQKALYQAQSEVSCRKAK